MTDVYRIGVAIAMSSNHAQVMGVISRDLLGLNQNIATATTGFSNMKIAAAGLVGVLAGGAVLSGMAKLVEHGKDFVHQQSLMAQGGVQQIDIANGVAAAWKTAHDVIGSNATENLKTVADLRNMLGDMSSATQALPQIAKINAVLGNVTGAPAGDAGFQFAKFLDLRGALVDPKTEKISAANLEAQARLGEAIIAGTRGRVGPADLLAFQRQARAAGATLSDDGLINAVPYIMAGGASRVGTQLSSLQQQLIGGVMTSAGAKWLEHARVLDAGKVHVGRGGHMTFDRGAIKDEALLRSDFATWVNRDLRAGLAAAGDSTMDSQMADVMRSHLRSTVVGLLAEAIRNGPAFERDAGNIRQAASKDQYAEGLKSDPVAQMNAFHDSWENLLTALGAPIVLPATEMMNDLTKALTGLTTVAANHPETVKWILGITSGLAALAAVGGAIMLASVALKPFTLAVGGLARLFVSGGAAAAATVGMGAFAAAVVTVGAAIAGAVALIPVFHMAKEFNQTHSWGQQVDNAVLVPAIRGIRNELNSTFGLNLHGGPDSVVPDADARSYSSGKAPSSPLFVHVTNTHDIASGTVGYLAHQMDAPHAGTTSTDMRVSPFGSGAQ